MTKDLWWKKVKELADLAKNIPPERRANSCVRRAVLKDRAEVVDSRGRYQSLDRTKK